MKFEKGDLVTHKCSPGDMKAKFHSYRKDQSSWEDKKVFVVYTEGRRKGCKGEWLEKYCVSQYKDKVVTKTENGFEVKCDPITTYQTALNAYDSIHGTASEIGSKIHEKLDKIALEQAEVQRQLRDNMIASARGSGKTTMQAAYAEMCMKSMRGSNIAGKRATHVIFDELEGKPHAEITDESFEEIHNDTAWGDYYDITKRIKNKKDWFKKMYSCDFSELENHAMAHMAPKQKHDDMVDALSSMYLGSPTKPTKETPMKETITEIYTDGVLTQTLIGDQDIETMTATDMLQAIGNVNNALEKLNKHDMSSTYVGKRAKKLSEFVESVYAILDNKFGDE